MNQIFVPWQTLPGTLSAGFSLTCSIDFYRKWLWNVPDTHSPPIRPERVREGDPMAGSPLVRLMKGATSTQCLCIPPKLGRRWENGPWRDLGTEEGRQQEQLFWLIMCHPHPRAGYCLWGQTSHPQSPCNQMELKQPPGTSRNSDKQKKQDLGVGREGGESLILFQVQNAYLWLDLFFL